MGVKPISGSREEGAIELIKVSCIRQRLSIKLPSTASPRAPITHRTYLQSPALRSQASVQVLKLSGDMRTVCLRALH